MGLPWLLAALAGTAVLVTTTVARRTRGPLAGVLAAAPITPTSSLLMLGPAGADVLLRGLPAVVLAIAGVLLIIVHRDPRQSAAVPGLAWVIIIGALLFDPRVFLLMGAVSAVIATRSGQRSRGRTGRPQNRLPAWARFCVGAGAILAVGGVQEMWPTVAGWIALAPWLFVASAIAAGLDGGPDAAVRVLHGGVGGAVGVGAFVLVVAAWEGPVGAVLALGWSAFAVVAVAWHPLWTRVGFRTLPRRPRPDRETPRTAA